jgi:hypothetical protein
MTMKLFRITKGTKARIMWHKEESLVQARMDMTFDREDVVLDAVILHNQPTSWWRDWPELGQQDRKLLTDYATRGDVIFGHRLPQGLALLAVARSSIELLT